MSLTPSPCDLSRLREIAREAGVDRLGFSDADETDPTYTEHFTRWLAEGNHAEMEYLARHPELRQRPEGLLPGAHTIISCAISYHSPVTQPAGVPRIAEYALGDDYHDVLRRRLEQVAAFIRDTWGGETRVCIDTAPLHERYRALRSGVGIRGLNGLIIVPGVGSRCFLGEILTTVHFPPSQPLTGDCGNCGRCLRACPGRAIKGDGTIDCRRCLSYLTIEHRGELPEGLQLGGRLYGCDTCQDVCPHNLRALPTRVAELAMRPAYATLTHESIAALTPEEYATLFRHSAIKRAKLAGLLRNLRAL